MIASGFRFFTTYTFAALFLLNSTALLAQMGSTVLFQGTAVDEKTKAPIEIKYEIKNADGQKFRGKSLPDGTFQQVLKPGQEYTISFMGKNIYRTPEIISLRASDKFYEEKRTFAVMKLTPGQQFEAMNLFKTGTAEMNTAEQELLKRILSGVKNEDFSTISIAVAADPVEKGAKKMKNKKKGKKGAENTIVNERIAVLTDVVSRMGEYVSSNVKIAPEKGKTVANVSIKIMP